LLQGIGAHRANATSANDQDAGFLLIVGHTEDVVLVLLEEAEESEY
jgi:hypothetical protein